MRSVKSEGGKLRCLIAINGHERDDAFTSLRIVLSHSQIALVHVIDDRAAYEVRQSRQGYLLHRGLRPDRQEAMARADETAAAAAFARTKSLLGTPTDDDVGTVLLHGNPEREVVREARERAADLVVVFGRGGDPGPKSIGKVARFIIDHVPCTILLVR